VVGAQFGYAGFTIGGAYGYDNNGLGSNYFTGVDNDTRFYTGGIMYETGPKVKIEGEIMRRYLRRTPRPASPSTCATPGSSEGLVWTAGEDRMM
jgi:hypothetical protein